MSDHLEANRELITAWMEKKRSEVPIPFYGSVDVRDAGWKIAVVDANHFPAGFNNIADQDLPSISQLMGTHIKRNTVNAHGFIFILKHTPETRAMRKTLAPSKSSSRWLATVAPSAHHFSKSVDGSMVCQARSS